MFLAVLLLSFKRGHKFQTLQVQLHFTTASYFHCIQTVI